METINIHEAKTHLSRLVDEAARGKAFVIAKAGKPLVKVSGSISVPDDFDTMGGSEIRVFFEGGKES
ncbi:MAG: type II toxin-antitoxin system prevent-host-death family antitoxin [Deltaproteobacteria bacterium]|nr:type II toxin-antitoxin system prevent-host-death family antitoxin [Deltaproteobacteria bacterium]